MELAEAVEIVVAWTKHERFRTLCDPGHPDFQPGYAHLVIAMATGEETSPAEGHHSPQQLPTPLETLPLAGDLTAALAKRFGADRLARWIEGKTGKPCGCPERQAALNRLDTKFRKYLGW